MYSVLLQDPAGVAFLNSDRRGMLFNELAFEIEHIVKLAATSKRRSIAHSYSVNSSNGPSQKNVFRMYSCTCKMGREFFALLGRISRSSRNRHLFDNTSIFQELSKLGSYRSLDYLSRLVFTSLSFTDGGYFSRHLLQIWITQAECSEELKKYCYTILRVLLRCKPIEGYTWCIESIMNMLSADSSPTENLIKALEEMIHNKSFMKMMIERRPKVLLEQSTKHILLRITTLPEGIEFLRRNDVLESSLERFYEEGCKNYMKEAEQKVSTAIDHLSEICVETKFLGPQPIPLQTSNFRNVTEGNADFYVNANEDDISSLYEHHSSANNSDIDPNKDQTVDLHGLMRVPWNIEAKLKDNDQTRIASKVGSLSREYLKLDTFLDISEMSSTLCFETVYDGINIIKVRGILVDSLGEASPESISPNKVISCTLLAGTCPVFKNGKIQVFVNNQKKKKSVNSSGNSNTQSGVAYKESISHQSGNRGSMNSNMQDLMAYELDDPVTLNQEYLFEWSECKPDHRNTKSSYVTPIDEENFALSVPGDPVQWIFSIKYGSFNLIEIQYLLRLETGQSLFVPMPRHLYGDLAKTRLGCDILKRKKIVVDLIQKARVERPSSKDVYAVQEYLDMVRSSLWALGHIGATDYGFALITAIDNSFIEWCIVNVSQNSNFSLRGTFFHALGLIGRSKFGSKLLSYYNWEVAPTRSTAVAIPRDTSALFKSIIMNAEVRSNESGILQEDFGKEGLLRALATNLAPQDEILNLISKVRALFYKSQKRPIILIYFIKIKVTWRDTFERE